jgi:hypothetical protein
MRQARERREARRELRRQQLEDKKNEAKQ